MENDRINDIVALIEGNLSPDQKANLLRDLQEDAEAADLAQLMMMPELRASNNFPPPFEIYGSHLIGFQEGL